MKDLNYGIYETDINDNIYVIGDIHGDYECLIHCLVDLSCCCKIKAIHNKIQIMDWIENNTSTIIFTGDLIHRKRFDHVMDDECSDIFIITEIMRLKKKAKANGGDILIISGNHEIMNIIYPDNNTYTSAKNEISNFNFFTNKESVNNYISNTFAWIKINDMLFVHGGLCSKYMEYIEKQNPDKQGDEIIKYVNIKYREYFTDFDYVTKKHDIEAYNLFENYDPDPNSLNHNMFWCRQWGYANINCEELKILLNKINCNKMVVAHCPQFLNPDKPQNISFKCKNKDECFNLARIDLGMSRAFEYNCCDDKQSEINIDNFENNIKTFTKYLDFNFNRKMQILKIINNKNVLNFNYSSIITKRLSCIQYLLLKYGIRKKDWNKKGFDSNWIGFYLIDLLYTNLKHKKYEINCSDKLNAIEIILCEIFCKKKKKCLLSIHAFNDS